jgi:hypothetical protein
MKEFNYLSLTGRCDISEQAVLYETVNGVLDNSEFLEQLHVNIRKGNLRKSLLLSHPKSINVQELAIA